MILQPTQQQMHPSTLKYLNNYILIQHRVISSLTNETRSNNVQRDNISSRLFIPQQPKEAGREREGRIRAAETETLRGSASLQQQQQQQQRIFRRC